MKFLLIGLGGGLGAVARYGLSLAVQSKAWGAFTTGTLIVNVVGCLAIGFLAPLLAEVWAEREELRLAVLVGLLGGFTTFSSYAFEALRLWQEGDRMSAFLVVSLSNVLGLLAVALGYFAWHRFVTSSVA